MPRRRKGKPVRRQKGKNKVVKKVKKLENGVLPRSTFQMNWPPVRIYCTLKWNIIIAVTTTSAFAERVWSGNNVFDPGLSLTASQPVWFDQVAAFYNNYRVWGSKVTVRAVSDSVVEPGYLVLYATNSSTGVGNYSSSVAQAHSVTRSIGYGDGQSKAQMSNFMNSSKILGTNIHFSNDFSAAISASPNIEWYWVLAQVSADDTSSLTVDYQITVSYEVEFYEKANVDLGLISKWRDKLIKVRDRLGDKFKDIALTREFQNRARLEDRRAKRDLEEKQLSEYQWILD